MKRNQPPPRTQLVSLPRADVPITDTQNDRGHGREGDEPTLKAVTVAAGIGFPHARQTIQITRKRRRLNSKKWTVETVYAITDLAPERAPPHQLRTWLRGQRASRQACNGSATSPTAKATLGPELDTAPNHGQHPQPRHQLIRDSAVPPTSAQRSDTSPEPLPTPNKLVLTS